PRFGAAALVAAHVGARAGLPAVMRLVPRARPDGLSVRAGRPDDRSAILSAGIGLLLVLLFAGFEAGLTAAALTALALWLTSVWAKRRIGGQTGDVLGGMEQIGEMVILLTLVAAII
ncbi:MAG: adenosylcobinamide-GDP ribazoletransferase, partial [Rhodospirillales bacterium]